MTSENSVTWYKLTLAVCIGRDSLSYSSPYFSTRGIIFYKIEFPSNRGRSYYREVALSNIFIGLFVRFLCYSNKLISFKRLKYLLTVSMKRLRASCLKRS